MKINVILTPYDHDYEQPTFNAFVSDDPACQGFGGSVEKAVGDLVYKHPEKFGVQVVELGRDPW